MLLLLLLLKVFCGCGDDGVGVGVVVGDDAGSDVVDAGVAECDAVIVDIAAVAGCCW